LALERFKKQKLKDNREFMEIMMYQGSPVANGRYQERMENTANQK